MERVGNHLIKLLLLLQFIIEHCFYFIYINKIVLFLNEVKFLKSRPGFRILI